MCTGGINHKAAYYKLQSEQKSGGVAVLASMKIASSIAVNVLML